MLQIDYLATFSIMYAVKYYVVYAVKYNVDREILLML